MAQKQAEEEVTRIMGPPGQRGRANPYKPPPPSPKGGGGSAAGHPAPRPAYVYGASATAKKIRRCGECEGCMREDCGKCEICLDKPRFGGPGKLKKACPQRKCEVVGTGKSGGAKAKR